MAGTILLYGPAMPHTINVSMESGLDGRNNEVQFFECCS